MILADTSVWVDHLRYGNSRMTSLLADFQVVCHPFVVGELSLGHLKPRQKVLTFLCNLPEVEVAPHLQVLDLVAEHSLVGTGLGWTDVHLLCSALSGPFRLWTFDKRLANVSARLGVEG